MYLEVFMKKRHESEVYNIGLGRPNWIEDILSNLKECEIYYYGRRFSSVEGPFQAIKRPLNDPLRETGFGLSGKEAKNIGRDTDRTWVWLLDGKRYGYRSPAHMNFIERLIREKVYQNPDVFRALILTGDSRIIHDLGHPESPWTALRAQEFCAILKRIRDELKDIREDYLRIYENYKAGNKEASIDLEIIRLEERNKALKIIYSIPDKEFFRNAVRSFNVDKKNEYLIGDWSVEMTNGDTGFVLYIDALKYRKPQPGTKSLQNVYRGGILDKYDVRPLEKKVRRIIKNKTGMDIPVFIHPEYMVNIPSEFKRPNMK